MLPLVSSGVVLCQPVSAQSMGKPMGRIAATFVTTFSVRARDRGRVQESAVGPSSSTAREIFAPSSHPGELRLVKLP